MLQLRPCKLPAMRATRDSSAVSHDLVSNFKTIQKCEQVILDLLIAAASIYGKYDLSRKSGLTQSTLAEPPLSPLHEPLHWRAKRDPKASFFPAVLFTEGRGVDLCWARLKPEVTKISTHVQLPVTSQSKCVVIFVEGWVGDPRNRICKK